MAEEQPVSHPVFVYAALLMALLGARALGALYPFPEILGARVGNYLLWWGAPGWAMTGALAAAFWRRPLPPPAVAALVAVVAAAGLWLVDGAPPVQWGRVLPEPYFDAPAVFLAAVSGGTLLYYVLIWGWPGSNLYRVGLTALLAALVLGGQGLVFRQALAVQNAAPGKTFGPDFRLCWGTELPGPAPRETSGPNCAGRP